MTETFTQDTATQDGAAAPEAAQTAAGSRRRRRTGALAGALVCCGIMVAAPAGASPATPAESQAQTEQQAAVNGTAPAQVKQLDFLLGDLSCVYNTGTKLTATDKLILGGTYVELDIKSTNALGSEKINGRWILGWDAVDSKFISYYYDNDLNQGTSSSPGRQNGQFTLTGSYVLAGVPAPLGLQDVFTSSDKNHFTIVESAQVQGAWKVLDIQTCVRTPTR